MDSVKGTPCGAAIEKALALARQILSGEVAPIDGAHQIAWLGTGDCYDFLNEADVVGEMAGFWQPVDDWEVRQDSPSARSELSEEIKQAARRFVEQFG